jgi:hypothetical protein
MMEGERDRICRKHGREEKVIQNVGKKTSLWI